MQQPHHFNPLISVIICTYGRASALADLLASLNRQEGVSFEVLVVDGNPEPSPARKTVENFFASSAAQVSVKVIQSPKGLTRQRNTGLRSAKGELICFLDDDVTFESNFLYRVGAFLAHADMQDVGGLTAYDLLNYPMVVSLKWKLRWLLGVMPGKIPGAVDHLGRAVPLSFLKPWEGYKEIGWLPGFCMIYRRSAIGGLIFDEFLPTYGGEDRDFSMRVGDHCRLLILGDLPIRHHYAVEGREDDVGRLWECSFGTGRRFGKYFRGKKDYFTIGRVLLGDLLIDIMAFLRAPVRINWDILCTRIGGLVEGFRSVRSSDSTGEMLVRRDLLVHHDTSASRYR